MLEIKSTNHVFWGMAPDGNELIGRAWHKKTEAEEDGETYKKETTNNNRLWKFLIDRWIQK